MKEKKKYDICVKYGWHPCFSLVTWPGYVYLLISVHIWMEVGDVVIIRYTYIYFVLIYSLLS